MATWQVALIREQGLEFGVVLVKDSVVDTPGEREKLVNGWAFELGRPVALMGERRFKSYGRQDIVKWLSGVHPSRLPWRQVTLN
ncbi:hypothetical protein ACF1BQ_036605 [Bradyrhizobium sp. RDT10]